MKNKISTRSLIAIAVAALALLAAATVHATVHANAAAQEKSPASAAVSVVEVKIDNFSFGPTILTIPAGTTVTWTNRDDIPHTVVSTENAFKSKVLDTDEKFSFTFTKPGAYPYFCSVHPKMTGQIIVK
jgi:plastocyanin